MRAALGGLTTRGRCLLAAGIAAAGCALALGQKDLLRVAILLFALPIISVAMVARTRFRIACSRELVPNAIVIGETAQVRLNLHNVSLLPTAVLLLEDDLPFALGGRPRFTVDRLPANGSRLVQYSVHSARRGRFSVGPLRLRLTDPFGLVELTRSFSARDLLRVAPAVEALPVIKLGGTWSMGRGSSDDRSVATRGDNDATTREYRHGDDLRRVHWRSTARVGKLMVRREERPWRARAILLLDTRVDAHRGDGPESSFEWAVSAVASIGVHLIRRGYQLDIMTEHGIVAGAAASESVLLDWLTDVGLHRYRGFEGAASALRLTENDATLIAVLGTMPVDVADVLSRSRSDATSVAVLLDTASWVTLGPASRERAEHGRRGTCSSFTSNGWRAVEADRTMTVSSAWAGAGIPGGVAPTFTADRPAGSGGSGGPGAFDGTGQSPVAGGVR